MKKLHELEHNSGKQRKKKFIKFLKKCRRERGLSVGNAMSAAYEDDVEFDILIRFVFDESKGECVFVCAIKKKDT